MTTRSVICTVWNKEFMAIKPEDRKNHWMETKKCPDECIRYMCWQFEIGEKSEAAEHQGLHAHIYAEFNQPLRWQRIKDIFGFQSMHLEKPRNREASQKYCMKETTRVAGPFEIGDFKAGGQGQRNDLKKATDMLKEGKSMIEIAIENPTVMVKYAKGMSNLAQMIKRKCIKDKKVIVHVGPSGSGKSHAAHNMCGCNEYMEANVWKMPVGSGEWFDGYWGQKYAIFDDFIPGRLSLDVFLQICDKYPAMVPTKGGFVGWEPEEIHITSNVPINKWFYIFDEQHIDAIARRIYEYRIYDTKDKKQGSYTALNNIELRLLIATRSDEVGGNTNTPTKKIEYETSEEQIEGITKYD